MDLGLEGRIAVVSRGSKGIRLACAKIARGGRRQGLLGVLLDATSDGKASRVVAAGTLRLRCVAVEKGPSMLIRPDARIAWAGEETDGLQEALGRWFNPALHDASRSEQ